MLDNELTSDDLDDVYPVPDPKAMRQQDDSAIIADHECNMPSHRAFPGRLDCPLCRTAIWGEYPFEGFDDSISPLVQFALLVVSILLVVGVYRLGTW